MKKLYAFSENYHNMMNSPQLSDKEKQFLVDSFGAALMHYEKEREKVPENKIPEFVRAVHKHIDVERNSYLKYSGSTNKITCKKGCSFCCHLNVDITMDEAELLIKSNPNIDWSQVFIQAQHDKNSWNALAYFDRKCVFLSDKGECTTYATRPHPCRNQLVVSDPAECDTINNPGGLVLKFNAYKAEVISSAFMNLSESGNMAQMLLKCKMLKQL